MQPNYVIYCFSLLLLCNSFSVWAGDVHKFMLKNGLKVIVKEDHRAPVVVSQVWYKVGGSYESEGKTGLSHMVEHMMFKGTERHGAGEFSRIMTRNGAHENAFTGSDFTAYHQQIAKDRLELCFEMEADRMRNLKLDEAEFQKERQVVLEERRVRTEDKPIGLLYEHFNATAFSTSPYQNPIVGWRSDIENYQIQDLQDWYTQWYAPNNAILVVVGDVEPQNVLRLAQRYFEPLSTSTITPTKPRPEIQQLGSKKLVIKRPAKVPFLAMGYKVPVLTTIKADNVWEVYALELLVSVLDGSDSARFSKHLVRGEEVAAAANANYDLYSRLETLLILTGIPATGHNIHDLETALRAQIQRLKTKLVDESELSRIKTKLRAEKVYELDSVFYQAMKIGSLETIGLDWRVGEEYLERISAVTPEQLRTVVQKYFNDDHLTTAVLEPQPFEGTPAPPAIPLGRRH